MRRRQIAIAIVLTACGHPVRGADPVDRLIETRHATPVHTAAAVPDALERTHGQHIADLRMIERDLIAGRLDDAKTLAYLLAQPSEAWMSPWPFDTAYVEAAALDLVTAADLDAALRSEARLVAACGRCHVDAHRLPSVTTPEPSEPTHGWAIDRVREGVVGATDSPWRSGLEALADARPPPDARVANAGVLATRMQDAARAQLDAPPIDLDERGVAYAALLATCASCHVALGAVRPIVATRATR